MKNKINNISARCLIDSCAALRVYGPVQEVIEKLLEFKVNNVPRVWLRE